MPSLPVPHLPQTHNGWCLPACIAMVAAFQQQPLLQDDIAQWIGTRTFGTPSYQVQAMTRHGFQVVFGTGSIAEMQSWLDQAMPPILFIRTGELSYWSIDTPHAIVLAGLDNNLATIYDPGVDTAPHTIAVDELLPTAAEQRALDTYDGVMAGEISWNRATQTAFGQGKTGKNYKAKLTRIWAKFGLSVDDLGE